MGTIRDQLGGEARVISVRSVKAAGVAGLLGGTRLEVIAQVPLPPTSPASDTPGNPFKTGVGAFAVPEIPAAPQDADVPTASSRTSALYANGTPATRSAVAELPRTISEQAPERLEALLRRSGLSETLVARLQSEGTWRETTALPLHQGLSTMAGRIRSLAAESRSRDLPARAAFIGMPGVGCTTALCKWLAAEVFKRGRRGTVASIEFDRPKGAEDLAVFAELLGVEFARQVPETTGERNFCYLDVPAISLTRNEENLRLRAYLDEARVPGRVLVVSGLHDPAVLRRACGVGLEIGCTHIVFTQLDELPQWGKLWDFLIDTSLSPLLLTLGPSLTGECETDVVGAVLRRTYPWN